MNWLIELTGDIHDLRDLGDAFPTGVAHVLVEGDKFFLGGDALSCIDTVEMALKLAESILDEFCAVVMVLQSDFRKPSLDAVYSVDENGKRSKFLFASAHERVRAHARATAVIDGQMPPSQPGPTEAQKLLEASRMASNAQAALMIWSDPMRTWPRLYRVLEELEADLKLTVSKAGFCTDDRRERFTRSANSAEVAGKDARHRGGKFDPPSRPMGLKEAVDFISEMIRLTLLRVAENERGAV